MKFTILLLALATSQIMTSRVPGFPRGKAPSWGGVAVVGTEFLKISSEDYKGKYTILLFYPFDFTYVCPTELIAFSEASDRFSALNSQVIGISTDSHFTHLAWVKTERTSGGVGKLNYPLLADFSKDISRSYGVLVEDPEDDLYGASLRGLFIIDGNGIIRHMQINDAPVGRSVEEALRLVEAFQYTDEHGEVCPANWKKGAKTIKPDQEDKLEFFASEYKN